MIETIYFDLVKEIQGIRTRDDGNRALQQLAEKYSLSHATYLGINIPSLTEKSLYYISTYSDCWTNHYVKSDFIKIDPVIKNGLSGILPFDWASLKMGEAPLQKFFGEAREHGVGTNGLSFPIRGAHGETALFSINSNASGKAWEELKKHCVRDFQVFAYHLHTSVLEAEGVKFADAALSQREVECLKWAAAGKTSWETSAVLGISEATVKFFLENARTKLGAVNKTQAVAKAVAGRLI